MKTFIHMYTNESVCTILSWLFILSYFSDLCPLNIDCYTYFISCAQRYIRDMISMGYSESIWFDSQGSWLRRLKEFLARSHSSVIHCYSVHKSLYTFSLYPRCHGRQKCFILTTFNTPWMRLGRNAREILYMLPRI